MLDKECWMDFSLVHGEMKLCIMHKIHPGGRELLKYIDLSKLKNSKVYETLKSRKQNFMESEG